MRRLALFWTHFLAFTRLSKRAVCEASKGNCDYHDYWDSKHKMPLHFMILTCERCGKAFEI